MGLPSGRTLYWDTETRSVADLRKVGVYEYARHPSTEVTVARLALDNEAPEEWRPSRKLQPKYRDAFEDPSVRVVAHNAAFERLMLRDILVPRHCWPEVPLERWDCTMARARAQALPGQLDQAAMAVGLDVRKDMQGHRLMLQMCRPRAFLSDGRPTWWDDEERMTRLSSYCSDDVRVERAIDKSVRELPPLERQIWELTERINDRGVRFDLDFIHAAREVAEETRSLLNRDMNTCTNGHVPTASNVTRLKLWLISLGVDLTPPPEMQRQQEADDEDDEDEDDNKHDNLPELRRRDVLRLLANEKLQGPARAALKTRLEAGKTSTRKLDSILHRADGRGVVRGLLGYHGASTGRYISQGVQVQNFPRDVVRDWDAVREALEMDTAAIDAIYGPPLELVSKMLRGSIVPDPGHDIMAVDYSQVEARGVAWLAGADELVRAFQTKQPIYEMMASRVYDCPVAEISKDSAERHLGKTLVLGAGYQMGWWKFRETVLSTTGILITMDLAMHAISTYREAVPEIPRLWYDLEAAALTATRNEGRVVNAAGGKIAFRRDRAWLRMRLPSGRYLWYRMPRIEVDAKYEREKLVYWAVNNKTRKWEETSTFGGRLTENAVQGLCRDLLVNGALALERAGYNPITMVHDENVLMPRAGFGSVEEAIEIMCRLPQWAKGFPLAAEGKRGPRYTK